MQKPASLIKAFSQDRRGAIAVIFALMLPVLMGFLGLGLEAGMWYQEKRDLQGAADAAAIAGAYELNSGGSNAEVATQAEIDASRNGFDAADGDTIVVNIPPLAGAYTADSTAVEVTLTRTINFMFAGIILDSSSLTLQARAVAITPTTLGGSACVLALDTTGPAISVSGSGSVVFDGCQVASNSADADSLSVSGNGALSVDCYAVAGDISVTAGLTTAEGCSGTTGMTPLADPYVGLTDPDDGICDITGNVAINSDTTYTGTEANPFVICGDLWAKSDTLTLNGLIVVKGDFKANATATVVSDPTNGSTIVLKDGGNLGAINGSATVNLTAPPAGMGGAWEGILFYQDRITSPTCTNNCNTLNGNSATSFEGVVYFPNQELSFSGGNSAAYTCLQLVAASIEFTGNTDVLADNDCVAAGVDPITVPVNDAVKLVE